MELDDSTNEQREQIRSAVAINLNEIPPSSSSDTISPDAFAVVRTFQCKPTLPAGAPADVPGDSCSSECAACGRSEVGGHVVVCDGCERGFHLGCAGIPGRQAVMLDEWFCGECVDNGVKNNRLTFGLKSKVRDRKRSRVRLLDVNALPPTVGEGNGSEVFPDARKHRADDNLEEVLSHKHPVARRFEEVDMHTVLRRFKTRSGNHTATRQALQNLREMHLQALREFICERQGVLEEGWFVDIKTSSGVSEFHPVYCSPGGKTFDSMPEVACHLGLVFCCNSVEPKVYSNGPQKVSHLAKRRKSARLSIASCFTENNESLSRHDDLSSEFHTMGCANKFENHVEVTGARPQEDNSGTVHQPFSDGLPVQYADFFVLSLGKPDSRPSYHDADQIWPVGYRSCWHDKITGSLFIFDVLDGGDSGPVFKVSRCSCSTWPIPNSATVLFTPNLEQSIYNNKDKHDDVTCVRMDYDDYCSVQMLLSDTPPPVENDMLSCLGSSSDKFFNVRPSNCVKLEASSLCQGLRDILSDASVLRDEIGEFSVEESKSSAAWRMVSKKFIDACRQIYIQRGTLKLFCEHVENRISLTSQDSTDEKNDGRCTSMARFFGSSCSIRIPPVVQGSFELETVLIELAKWLDQDRCGLDVEFVQEIIEQLPGVHACSRYVFLKERSLHSSLVTVGNGLLLVKTKDRVQNTNGKALGALFRGCKRAMIEKDPAMESPRPPQGNHILSKLPPEVVGDVLQIGEFLWRFYEVLSLEGPLSIGQLEDELSCPWFAGLSFVDEFGGKIQESHDVTSPRTDGSSKQILSSRSESAPAVITESPHSFLKLQEEALKDPTLDRMESVKYSRCTGIALSKVHSCLLKILIGELQSKVTAIIDPNFDDGESKSKRGKKKDLDCSVATNETKLIMLPLNELTWPELARRYILAVLSMDGNVDSAEIATRESGKVFRCLQGDGGVLCGSLTGVVGLEADALAMKKIFGSVNRENDMLTIDDGGSDATSACESFTPSIGDIPEWARLLEPVKKLPTNVGARIRNCVYGALEKGPPDWAKKILEHSISKGVYKGNASGPTKKAVVSVLENIYGEGMRQKPVKERKRKNYVSISFMIMKKCRIVLRQVAAADTEKVFCNLLGRKVIGCSDNDEDGILGSPAMVSRPLDFRSIDLRLAVGAYGGSHEAFLEDVRELWRHIQAAYSDQPNLVQLAQKLSSNFEELYGKEVVSLFQKFVEYAKSGCLTTDSKKEIDDFLVSLSELPKAPWEEGVCKVCGIDKDDESVLLCDTCDAEYHTYCLNPPLARIPKENWYCPSCVCDNDNIRDASGSTSITSRNLGKYGEVTRACLEALMHLVSVLEQKEYWEINVDERTLLLKFLCDELLNSAPIRQHLEHSVVLSADLQQKLRSISMELRNLKCKEEVLAANIAKAGKCASFSNLEEKSGGNGQKPVHLNAEDRHGDVEVIVEGSQSSGNFSPHRNNLEKELRPSNLLQQEINHLRKENSFHGGMKKSLGRNISSLPPPEDLQRLCPHSGLRSSQIVEHVPSTAVNESQAISLELNSVRNEISLLQDSISSLEMQLMKLSVRREFLGSDSSGRLYWVLAKLGRPPSVIVNHREVKLQEGVKMTYGSGASCPNLQELSDATTLCSPWLCYQTDTEIQELVEFLRDEVPKERELKESILHRLKLRFPDSKQTENQGPGEPQMDPSGCSNRENPFNSESLLSEAGRLLNNKYGPWSEAEATDLLKKRGRKAKMFRCSCLEPVWPSRNHCLSCHRTYFAEVEVEGRNDARCKLCLPASKKSKGNNDLKSKLVMRFENLQEECTAEMDNVEEPKCGGELSNLIKYQNDRLVCPYDFQEICSKFETKNSTKELIQEIGLIGTNGIPMFVPSASQYLSDATLMLVPPNRDEGVSCEEPKAAEHKIVIQGIRMTTNGFSDSISNSLPGCAANGFTGAFKIDKPVGSLERKDENLSLCGHAPALEVGNCCVIPESALRPLGGKASQILRRLKINLLDMDASLPELALRPSKAHLERRWAWREFVKSTETIYEMVQAVIVFEDMIKSEYLRNMWWYWSSLSAAAKIATLSSLALRIYSLDASIDYEKNCSNLDQVKHSGKPVENLESVSDATEKIKPDKKLKRKRGD